MTNRQTIPSFQLAIATAALLCACGRDDAPSRAQSDILPEHDSLPLLANATVTPYPVPIANYVQLAREERWRALHELALSGDEIGLRFVFEEAMKDGWLLGTGGQAKAFNSLRAAWEKHGVRPTGNDLIQLVDRYVATEDRSDIVDPAAMRLATAWQLEGVEQALTAYVDEKAGIEYPQFHPRYAAAIECLGRIGSESARSSANDIEGIGKAC